MISLLFDKELSGIYKSKSQLIRVQSEGWLLKNMYCPCCGNPMLQKFENNKPVADFFCDKCSEQFELKSTNKTIKNKIVDGAYETAIKRVKSNSNPDLFVLQYQSESVTDLIIVPKYFFTPNIIEKRRPLGITARRAGWIGSNIIYKDIPTQGKIKIISNGEIIPQDIVLAEYQKASRLNISDIDNRGWLFDVMNCINSIDTVFFTINDLYLFEATLQKLHPENHNIRAKIRQQLQYLRDKGFIDFVDNKGRYKKI